MSYKAVFFQRWFESKPILQKKQKYFIFSGNGGQFVFEISFWNLRAQKLKIGCFYEFIPGFPKRLSRIIVEHWKWGYYNVVCKICGSAKSAIFEISEKN